MKFRATALILAVVFGGCLAPAPRTEHAAFQLVYDSDTRGFYNPCG
ncbi:MAG: hypothetical protein HY770_01760 [Chitinivibrionia bacterium]|nr:hypothetical protein [Chitinivibrionia bacterium]